LKQGQVLSPLLFKFVLEYAIIRVQAKQDAWKLSGRHKSLVYADYVNMLRGNLHTIKENPGVFVVASKEIGLQVNADKNKYMGMCRHQSTGRSYGMKIDNSPFGRECHSKHL
jgi:hypothetical protein